MKAKAMYAGGKDEYYKIGKIYNLRIVINDGMLVVTDPERREFKTFNDFLNVFDII